MQYFESNSDNLWISCVECSLNRNDKLWDDWKNLGSTSIEHVKYTLDSKEPVRIHLFSYTLKENGKVVMVVKLLLINLPIDLVLLTMQNAYR